MSTDLQIHVVKPPLERAQVIEFLGAQLGSKHFSWTAVARGQHVVDQFADPDSTWSRVTESPSIRIGELDWGEGAEYTHAIRRLIGEDMPALDEALIGNILAAYPDDSPYKGVDKTDLQTFLEAHFGLPAFYVAW